MEAYIKIAANIDKMTELSCENDKLLWNEAIEQAAKLSDDNVTDSAIGFGDKIRKLKK